MLLNVRSNEKFTAVEKAMHLQRKWFIDCVTDYASAVLIDSIFQPTFDAGAPILLFANPNVCDHNKNPVLFVATCYRNVAAVQYLTDACADVNATSSDGWTSLLAAAALGDSAMCDTLLKCRASVHSTLSSCHNSTPLQLSAAGGFSDVVTMLLSHGASLDSRNSLGLSAVHLAVLHGHRDLAFALISKAKDASAIADSLQCPQPPLLHRLLCSDLHESVILRCVNLLLLFGFHADDVDETGRTPLQISSEENLTLVCAALASHAKSSGGDNRTVLFAAVDQCDSAALDAFIMRSSDLNCREFFDHGRPLLHAIVRSSFRSGSSVHDGMIDCLSKLSNDPRCDIDALDDQGCTALHVAVAIGHAAAARILLNAGAESDSTSLTCCALCAALTAGNAECTELLLQYGADLTNPLGPHGIHSCVAAAVCSGLAAVVRRVTDHVKANHRQSLRMLCEFRSADDGNTLPLLWILNSKESDSSTLGVLKVLLLAGSDVLQCNYSSLYPVQVAAARSFLLTSRFISSIAQCRMLSLITGRSPAPDIRSLLHSCLCAGAELDLASDAGLLPIHVCASIGPAAAMLALINICGKQAGDPLKAVDSKGHSALCHCASSGRADLLPILLRSSISRVSLCGCSVLAHAIVSRQKQCIQVLLESGASWSQDALKLDENNPCFGVDSIQLACVIADVEIVSMLAQAPSSSAALRRTVYQDGGSVVHYLASLKQLDLMHPRVSISSAGPDVPVSVVLANILAHSGAPFLRRNNQVQSSVSDVVDHIASLFLTGFPPLKVWSVQLSIL
jgi:ankyrin repeat protein